MDVKIGAVLILALIINARCELAEETKPVNDIALELKRWVNISATSTCGQHGPERFCLVTTTGHHEGHHCEWCYGSGPDFTHPISNAIDGSSLWWKSANTPGRVDITINLKQQFFVTSILVKMGPSSKPAIWSLERSDDYGQNYRPWLYLVSQPHYCAKFGLKHNQIIKHADDVLCQSSSVKAIEQEEVVINLIKGRPEADSFSKSEALQSWTRATNIKIIFYKLQTFGGEHIVNDLSIRQTQFYTIRDIVISGRCVCHGHDKGCEFNDKTREMECQCAHNTCGRHCEICCPGYNQYYWQPLTAAVLPLNFNGCKACNCFGHSDKCYFNATVARNRLSIDVDGHYRGGGVCTNCLHDTGGINCERCRDGFYRYTNEPRFGMKNCKECNCNQLGSYSNVCDNIDGQCPCLTNVIGKTCDSCLLGFWSFPNCKACNCSSYGSLRSHCNSVTGQCSCKEGMIGLHCDKCGNIHNSIITGDGCIACQQCSMDHLNSARLLLKWINFPLMELHASAPLDSWVHVKHRWIDNQTQFYHRYRAEVQRSPRIVQEKVRSLQRSANYLVNLIGERRFTRLLNKANEAILKTNTVNGMTYEALNKSTEFSKMIDLSNNLIHETCWILRNFSQNLKKKCSNSCKNLVESRSIDFMKEISSYNLAEKKKLYFKELNAATCLHREAEKLQKNMATITKLRHYLNKINRKLTIEYRDYTLCSSNISIVHQLINPAYRQRVKETINKIEAQRNEINYLLNQPKPLTLLWKNYNSKVLEARDVSRAFRRLRSTLKNMIDYQLNNLHKLSDFKEKYLNASSYLNTKRRFISNEFSFIKNAASPFNRTLELLNKIPVCVTDSDEVLQQTDAKLLQTNNGIQNVNKLLANLTMQPEQLLFTSFPKHTKPVNKKKAKDMFESSGYYSDDSGTFSDTRYSLQNSLWFLNDMLNDERSKLDVLNHAVSDKLYETNMLPSLLDKSDRILHQNKEIWKALTNQFYNLSITRSKYDSKRHQSMIKNRQSSQSAAQTKKKVENIVNNYGKRLNGLHRELTIEPLTETKAKVDYATSLVNLVTNKLAKALCRQIRLPNDFLNKLSSVKSQIDRSRDMLSVFQIPVNFVAPSYALVILPESALVKSLVTTLELWFTSAEANAFLLSLNSATEQKSSVAVYIKAHRLVVVLHQDKDIQTVVVDHPLAINNWHYMEFKWINNLVSVSVQTHSLRPSTTVNVNLGRSFVRKFEPLIYVGGLPQDKIVNENYSPHLTGCLGGLKFNGQRVDMFAWEHSSGVTGACPSSPLEQVKTLSTLSLNGEGGLHVLPSKFFMSKFPHVEFFVKTVQKNAVIAFITDTDQKETVTIKLKDGRIMVKFEEETGFKKLNLSSANKYNDGKPHHIKVSSIGETLVNGVKLTIDELDRASGALYNPSSMKNVIYLGTSRHIRNGYVREPDFIGCLLGVKINNKPLTQISRFLYSKFDFTMSSCPTMMGGCMCLTETSSNPIRVQLGFRIETWNLLFSRFAIGRQCDTTILYYSASPYSWLEIYLTVDDELRIKWETGSNVGIKNSQNMLLSRSVSRLAWHSIILKNSFTQTANYSILSFDNERVTLPVELFSGIRFSSQNFLHLGGRPNDMSALKSNSHPICFRDFMLNDELKDFSGYAITNGLELCPR